MVIPPAAETAAELKQVDPWDAVREFIIHTKYARHIPELERRETFDEILTRLWAMHAEKIDSLVAEGPERDAAKLKLIAAINGIRNLEVLPSMRSLQFAGPAIDKNPSRIYNCAYSNLIDAKSFADNMFLLLGGSGTGYSCKREHVEQIGVFRGFSDGSRRYLVADTAEGWADALLFAIDSALNGLARPVFDYREIREKGAPLKTSGGRAPGPEPLRHALNRIMEILDTVAGRHLRPIEAHDIMCLAAEAVLSGGIRRSAMLSLFDMDDVDMIRCKTMFSLREVRDARLYEGIDDAKLVDATVVYEDPYYGERTVALKGVARRDVDLGATPEAPSLIGWWVVQPQRSAANNSAALLRGAVTQEQFQGFWDRAAETKSGDPAHLWIGHPDYGANPCVEIGLRPRGMCNLTEVNCSGVSTYAELMRRIHLAVFLGTLQATYTDFHYLHEDWIKNCVEEALLGVSLTGLASCPGLWGFDWEKAAQEAVLINHHWASVFGIKPAQRVTCVKPSGTASLVLGCSSGIHAYYGDYYLRRLTLDKDEPVYQYLSENHPELLEDHYQHPSTRSLFVLPLRAPEGSITRDESSLDLLERIKHISMTWIRGGHISGPNSHNVSSTVEIEGDMWGEVGKWMWDERESYNGIAYFPRSGGTFTQAPFEEIDEEEYHRRVALIHAIDLSRVVEHEDATAHRQTVACAGGQCDL